MGVPYRKIGGANGYAYMKKGFSVVLSHLEVSIVSKHEANGYKNRKSAKLASSKALIGWKSPN